MAPDLDLRPGEPARGTLKFWVQTCAGCGASAPDLAALPARARAVVEGAAYRAWQGPDAAFLRWAALATGTDAAEAMLQAAWALDDAGQDGSVHRLAAVDLWGPPASPLEALRQADVLRRAGAPGPAAALLDGLTAGNGEQAALVAFQRARIAAGDRGRHSISSALPPPARRPHGSHGTTPARAGFWARLRGS